MSVRYDNPDGNKGIKRARLAIVQAMGSMTSIINGNADQMPHQMRNVGNGRIDTLKFLPAGNNWKHIRSNVNEVYSYHSRHLASYSVE